MKEKILVTHKLFGKYLDKLREDYSVVEGGLEKIGGCAGVISMLGNKVDRKVMDVAGEKLRVIGNFAVGFDNIDVGEASSRGIVVLNTPGVLTEAVAEHVMALTLTVARRIVEGDAFVRAGKYKGFEPDLLIGTGIRGKVMGVVGLGRIGRWVGRMALGMGMEVIYYSPHEEDEYQLETGAKRRGLHNLLAAADVISINVPLTEDTRGMIGKEQFDLMKRTAVLINTARGAVVDEGAMIAALKSKRIVGAGLDVYTNESEVNEELVKLTNVVLTPHIASATIEARMLMSKLVVEGVIGALNGKCPENIVNKDVWEKRRLSK